MEAFLLFFLYSFFGCVLENVYHFALHREYVSKRTLLKLPLCPVYGFSALILCAVNTSENVLTLFFNGFFAVSAAELMFFLMSEKFYGIKWWDYSARKLNFMGGICPFYSVLWGLLNIPFAKFLHPAVMRLLSVLSPTSVVLCSLFLAVYTAADFKETHNELIRHKNGENTRIFDVFSYLPKNN